MNSRVLARSESGTSLVEFALVAPVIIFLLVGLIEIGRFAFFSILAANAARAGAQYGAQNLMTAYDSAGITNAALQDGQNLSNWTAAGAGIVVQQLCAVSGGSPRPCGDPSNSAPPQNTIYYVKVQVTGLFNSLLNYPGIPNSLPISGSAMMRVASQ
jgi:Flp pilus assembly protein TadG